MSIRFDQIKTAPAAALGRTIKRLAALAGKIVVGLLLTELLFRALIFLGLIRYPAPDFARIVHRYAANRELLYEMRESFHGEGLGMVIDTNSWGMRDREFAVPKPRSTIRIAVLGDSVTFGIKLRSYLETYPKILETMLNSDPRQSYEVLNYAVVGYNSSQEEIVLREKVIKAEPDLVVLGFCLNDATLTDGFAEIARQMAPWSIGSRLHSKALSYLLHKFEAKRNRYVEDRSQIDRLFGALHDLGTERRFRVVILVFPKLFDDPAAYPQLEMHRYVGALAARYDFPVVDYLDLWKGVPQDVRVRLYLPNDKTHFSALGMRYVAEGLYNSGELPR
jgi:lysophospholipase L1-like esterase